MKYDHFPYCTSHHEGSFLVLAAENFKLGECKSSVEEKVRRRREQAYEGELEEVGQGFVANSSKILIGNPHCSLFKCVSPNPPISF